jgi:peptide deformylase
VGVLKNASQRGFRKLAVRKITQYPDPILREKVKPVEQIDDKIQRLIDDMFDTLYAAPGLGLAAPQVGISLRLFVYDMATQEGAKKPPRLANPEEHGTLINPEILLMEGTQSDEEGCLSVVNYRENVKRANRVRIKGLNREGQEVQVEGEGLLARLFQHEVDHLNGVLYIDRLSSLKKNIFLRKLKKHTKLGV